MVTVDPEKCSIQDRFQHLLKVISGERFLKKQGLGNEVPFFICPYRAEEAVEMERLCKQLTNRLSQKGVTVLEVNLYDLANELIKERGIWERILEVEAELGGDKAKLLELLQGVLDPEEHIIPAISKKMAGETFDVLFLTGVGEVYPYIRSHNILNNLQSTAKEKPTVLFFPGSYVHTLEKGASLILFGRLPDDKYYRAFNIFHYEA